MAITDSFRDAIPALVYVLEASVARDWSTESDGPFFKISPLVLGNQQVRVYYGYLLLVLRFACIALHLLYNLRPSGDCGFTFAHTLGTCVYPVG
jgi:hypothetical protein